VDEIEGRIEAFLRSKFRIAADDPGFHPTADLYEDGYVDSVGIVELVAFLQQEFQVDVPEHDMLSDDFSTVEGLARIVHSLRSS
jgi:acyl carrier protein